MLLTAMAFAAITATAAPADNPCPGPFTSAKYPVPHLVILVPETRCYYQWIVDESSPEDVRCSFQLPLDKPTTLPGLVTKLSKDAYDAFVERIMEQGGVNTSAWTGDHYGLSGFHDDLTPTDGTPGC